MQEKTVLVVDDSESFHGSIKLMTGRTFPVRFIAAARLDQAISLFGKHRAELDAILLDGCVESRTECDTLPLIDHFKRCGYRGPLIAISASRHHRHSMVKHGATMACEKHEIRSTLEELLFPPVKKKFAARR